MIFPAVECDLGDIVRHNLVLVRKERGKIRDAERVGRPFIARVEVGLIRSARTKMPATAPSNVAATAV